LQEVYYHQLRKVNPHDSGSKTLALQLTIMKFSEMLNQSI